MRDNKVTHVNVTLNHIYQALPTPAPVQARPRFANEQQREVLRLLVSIRPHDRGVFDFMEREFGTRMVIDLNDLQLKRARRYAETVQAKATRSAGWRGQDDEKKQHEVH
ncbi:hypothetical protein HNP55_003549 [Paucibacter oligotrophus]|uniref:Uncharacterized protein n=1 Tax=Roseateles oligotrophus TaxID=1769250 RepID=A0A840LEB5_9BURK|nr:hypothetical protein [Roseateles oligotrophus]MBB4845003.1 hypothetical protein [Roseateles oligotrophus]